MWQVWPFRVTPVLFFLSPASIYQFYFLRIPDPSLLLLAIAVIRHAYMHWHVVADEDLSPYMYYTHTTFHNNRISDTTYSRHGSQIEFLLQRLLNKVSLVHGHVHTHGHTHTHTRTHTHTHTHARACIFGCCVAPSIWNSLSLEI